jgi:hypothetical protein
MLPVFKQLGEVKSVIGGLLIILGVLVTALGISKVPSQQRAIASALEEHNKKVTAQTDQTNRKLDVLICLQARLDTPIRCVARERQP